MVQSLTGGGFVARETERLVLRRITIDDWQSVHRYMSDTVVTKWVPEGCFVFWCGDSYWMEGTGFNGLGSVTEPAENV